MAPAPLDPRHPHVSRLNPLERPEPRRWRTVQRRAAPAGDGAHLPGPAGGA